jgi:hypothetical protein
MNCPLYPMSPLEETVCIDSDMGCDDCPVNFGPWGAWRAMVAQIVPVCGEYGFRSPGGVVYLGIGLLGDFCRSAGVWP